MSERERERGREGGMEGEGAGEGDYTSHSARIALASGPLALTSDEGRSELPRGMHCELQNAVTTRSNGRHGIREGGREGERERGRERDRERSV